MPAGLSSEIFTQGIKNIPHKLGEIPYPAKGIVVKPAMTQSF
jgi:hypothetical protein